MLDFVLQVQKAYDTWRQAGERMVQLGLHAQHHRRWKSCQKAFKVQPWPRVYLAYTCTGQSEEHGNGGPEYPKSPPWSSLCCGERFPDQA